MSKKGGNRVSILILLTVLFLLSISLVQAQGTCKKIFQENCEDWGEDWECFEEEGKNAVCVPPPTGTSTFISLPPTTSGSIDDSTTSFSGTDPCEEGVDEISNVMTHGGTYDIPMEALPALSILGIGPGYYGVAPQPGFAGGHLSIEGGVIRFNQEQLPENELAGGISFGGTPMPAIFTGLKELCPDAALMIGFIMGIVEVSYPPPPPAEIIPIAIIKNQVSLIGNVGNAYADWTPATYMDESTPITTLASTTDAQTTYADLSNSISVAGISKDMIGALVTTIAPEPAPVDSIPFSNQPVSSKTADEYVNPTTTQATPFSSFVNNVVSSSTMGFMGGGMFS